MKIMAFNGSPRKKNWNTVTLLNHALDGAQSVGAEVELVQLYDLNFSGCLSCFSCKSLKRKEDGVCAIKDDLSAVLDRVKEADALVIGTPVYFGVESAVTRAFLERLCFPYLNYSKDMKSLFPKSIPTALIYTMNIKQEWLKVTGFNKHFEMSRKILEINFGSCEMLLSTDTLQYSDYDEYESEHFDKEEKLKRHAEVFPEDCKRSFELGVRMVSRQI